MDTLKEVSDFLRKEKLYMYSLIVKSIKEAWKNKILVITIIEFHVTSSKDIIKVDIHENDFKRILSLALDYYEDNEFYEKCLEIKQLISDINI